MDINIRVSNKMMIAIMCFENNNNNNKQLKYTNDNYILQ